MVNIDKQGKTAILLGATGLVGEALLRELLADDNYEKIKLFSRRSSSVQHPKIQEYLGDIVNLDAFAKDFTGDEIFCCIGTTAAKTKDKQQYKAIDIGIPAAAARLAKANNIEFFAVISAMGANPKSAIFYNRVKGDMERSVLAEDIKHTYIVRPSLLYGPRKETRLAEDMGNWVLAKIRPLMIAGLKKYRPIDAQQVASYLHQLAQNRPQQCVVLSHQMQLKN